jgi:sugar lactone lactonase YvrE
MKKMEAVHVLGAQNIIGEGPLWNEEEQALYWVDIVGKTINRYWPESGKHESFAVDAEVGVIAFREADGVVTAGSTGYSFWDPENNKLEPISDPESDKPESRFNDGKVDRKGRFWAGTMTSEGAVSSLYRMDTDLSVHRMDSGITISNGIGWSPDNRIMYFADSMRYVIYSYDFDLETGAIANRQNLIEVKQEYGIPDGLTVDSEGFIWCAFYAGSKVTRFHPQGDLDLEVTLPVSQPTSCIFGGKDYTDLYVTSAWNGLSDDERKKQPQAGDLFVIKTNVRGMQEPKFAG